MYASKYVAFVANLSRVYLVEQSHLNERVEYDREMKARRFHDLEIAVDYARYVHEILYLIRKIDLVKFFLPNIIATSK